jgi:isopentenyl diphosphate isomerase/L-lactate dehydrogenase-like FMN-dependent dehydrogenase
LTTTDAVTTPLAPDTPAPPPAPDVADVRTLHQLVARARKRLADEAWDYLSGGAETETTLLRNRLGLDSLAFNPRVLRDVSNVDATGNLLGHALRLPVILAPVGSLTLADPEAAAAVARAATTFGTMQVLSAVATPSLEEVAAAGTAPMVYQLYVRGDRGWIDEQLARVRGAGYVAVCITVDSAYYSRRERDLIRGYVPKAPRQGDGREFQAALDWDVVQRIIATAGLPVMLKGVTHPDDADRAVREGVQAVYVSNHGGRQLDHAPATIDQLPEVVAAVDGRAAVIVDGGFLRGTDVIKALALGADAVAIGKLQAWALAGGGERGLVRALELLEIEVRMAMALIGVTSVAELGPEHVRRVAPVAPPGITSAFPFLASEIPGIR